MAINAVRNEFPTGTLELCLAAVAAVALSLFCGTARGAAGDADPSFGGAGYVRYAAPKTIPGLFAAALGLDDGSAIVTGGADADVFVRHYWADGTLDTQFGGGGTTFVPGLDGGGFSTPALHLIRRKGGDLLVEEAGIVRRVTADGTYDSNYMPAQMNVVGSGKTVSFSYAMLPLDDGRFVVVTTPQAGGGTSNVSVRYYLADGRPDTVRGDVNGERILVPSDNDTVYRPTSAVIDSQGRILIAARLERSGTQDTGLVVLRLNPDGGYDPTFGTGGVSVIGTQLGIVNDANVVAGTDGRIGFLFSVPEMTRPVSYLVVYVLTANGEQDPSAPSGGRISLIVAPETILDERALQWVSGSPVMTVAGYTRPHILSNGNPQPALQIAQWHIDLSSGVIGSLELTNAGLDSTFLPKGFALAGGSTLWTYGGEDNFPNGNVSFFPPGSGRGVLLPFDATRLTTSTPLRISFTLDGHYFETFKSAQVLSDGGLLVLGTYASRGQSLPALTQFTADGRIDLSYGGGTGRHLLDSAGTGGVITLLESREDSATVLSRFLCLGGFSQAASLKRYGPTGMPDTTFGDGGTLTLAGSSCVDIVPGFVEPGGAVTLLMGSRPVRYTANGAIDPSFSGAELTTQFPQNVVARRLLDQLPDGRLQAISRRADGIDSIEVFRWLSNGAVDSSLPPTVISLATETGGPIGAFAFDMRILPDSRSLVAINGTNQRVLLRLQADGSLDTTFGSGGMARIDGLKQIVGSSKLAIESDGKILYTYTIGLGAGLALAVSRFTSDGQRDTTFTSDGRFDSIFSLSGYETASDLIGLSDGGLLAVGQSGLGPQNPGSGSLGFGLLVRLRGTASSPAQSSAAVVEFFNTRLGHYFVSGGPGEIVSVDNGGAGPGWERTGLGFRAYLPETSIPSGAVPVCRFYGTPGRGPNSHFYTVSASECAAVKQDPGWTYEGTAFYLFAPVNGQCANGQQAVYRAYNNRFAQNDSNHRYADDLAVLQPLAAQGWTIEGVVFCAPPF